MDFFIQIHVDKLVKLFYDLLRQFFICKLGIDLLDYFPGVSPVVWVVRTVVIRYLDLRFDWLLSFRIVVDVVKVR